MNTKLPNGFEITNTKFAAPGISTLLYAKYNGEEIKASIKLRKINPASSELKIEFNQRSIAVFSGHI